MGSVIVGKDIDWTFYELTGILPRPKGVHGKTAALVASTGLGAMHGRTYKPPLVNAMWGQWSGRIVQLGRAAISCIATPA